MPGCSAPLSSRIDQKREQIQQHKAKEGVLSTTIQRFSTPHRRDAGRDLGDRAAADAGAEQPRPARRRSCSRSATGSRRRATGSSGCAASSPPRARCWRARLVEIYKADAPDALTVILESDGFGDLLERAEFLKRISDQDREITDRVRGLRDQAKDQAVAARRPRGAGAARGRADPPRARPGRRRREPARGRARPARLGARRQARRARPGARQPRGARGRPRGAREGAGARPGRAAGRGADLRRADPAGKRRS